MGKQCERTIWHVTFTVVDESYRCWLSRVGCMAWLVDDLIAGYQSAARLGRAGHQGIWARACADSACCQQDPAPVREVHRQSGEQHF